MTDELLGYVSVDSGQIIIVDPCYILDDEPESIINGTVKFDQALGNFTGAPVGESADITYDNACVTTLSPGGGGQCGLAVASRTNWGDGSYPVYVERDAWGKPARLIIDFLADTDEEIEELNQWLEEEEDEGLD